MSSNYYIIIHEMLNTLLFHISDSWMSTRPTRKNLISHHPVMEAD